MALSNQLKNQHLLWRAGFGPAVEQIQDLSKYTPQEFYKALVRASSKKPEYIDVADNYLKGLVMGIGEVGKMQQKEIPEEERKKIQQKNRQGVRNLNLYWINEMVNSKSQLREKMSFFWHGHFACRNLNVFYQQGLLDVIRVNALGSFRKLLHEVSRSAAMLFFLNNQQNRKDHPNENFAREVMELFTVGRGHYTENDIKEAAKAFTGWGANVKGEFIFRRGQHDYGTKTVLSKTGNFDGGEVLDILLEQKQTAKYISQKIYRFFINENVDEEKLNWLADRFYKSDYNISKLMEDIFTSDWFYDEKNIGCQIKSPVELLVGIQRMLPMQLQNEEVLQLLQRLLGQMLFYPPSVAGWAGGKAWIDSSTLMMRMRIPQMLNEKDELNVKPKDDDDQQMGRKYEEVANEDEKKMQMKGAKRGGAITVDIEWDKYINYYQSVSKEKLMDAMQKLLLQTKSNIKSEVIQEYADGSSRKEFIKSATLQIMSTPEYQLC